MGAKKRLSTATRKWRRNDSGSDEQLHTPLHTQHP
eukprot:gene50279-24619_t